MDRASNGDGMKQTITEHADRFSAMAADYDDSQDSEEYRACASLVVDHERVPAVERSDAGVAAVESEGAESGESDTAGDRRG